MALEFLRNIASPWIWLYPDESLGRRLLNWWWVYGLFALGTGALFYQQLLAEEYIYLALIPVFHLVLLVFGLQTVGPMIDPAWPITNVALPLPIPEP
jgi:hypothetical protein